MRYEHTPALALALQRAVAYARRAAAEAVAPLHVLLGLLADDEGQAAVLLGKAGTDWPRLRVHLGLTGSPPDAADDLPLTRDTRVVLGSAHEIAALHSAEGTLSSDQVLLALLREAEELRADLERHGLNFARLQELIDPAVPPIALDEPLAWDAPDESLQAARIVDAGANRAREAMRVLEDFVRFVLDDGVLSGQLKQLRHDFAAALGLVPGSLLLAARDTENDVGTHVSTEQEWQRGSLRDVVRAGAARLQEALRSLEEFGKVLSPEFGQAVEQVRYRSYTLEKALAATLHPERVRLADARLYVLVTESLCRASLVGTVKEVCLGGAQVIQLREKGLDDRRLLALARDVRAMTRSAGVLFIVNDRPDIARLAEADGVHLGQDDLPVREARRILGPDAIVGVSTHNVEQVRQAVLDGASYLGVGPTFPSRTKPFDEFPGLEFLRAASSETSLPAFALGGITRDNLGEVLAAGAKRVAVSHAVCAAEEPRRVTAEFRRVLDGG